MRGKGEAARNKEGSDCPFGDFSALFYTAVSNSKLRKCKKKAINAAQCD